MKRCICCFETKNFNNFYLNKERNKHQSKCKTCCQNGLKSPPKLKQNEIDIKNGTKMCPICSETKPLDRFPFDSKRNYYQRICRYCSAKIKRDKRKNNSKRRFREEIDIQNGNKTCSCCNITKDLTEFYRAKKGWNSHCKECTKQRSKKHQQKPENREKANAWAKARRKTEKYLEIKTKRNLLLKERRKNDPQFKLVLNLRRRINRAIQENNKSANSLILLGCSSSELKTHLEKQFLPGMTWENYGYRGWHVDHIIPCAKFNLILAEEQQKCFRYTNLQPLWWIDNLKKRDKIL